MNDAILLMMQYYTCVASGRLIVCVKAVPDQSRPGVLHAI